MEIELVRIFKSNVIKNRIIYFNIFCSKNYDCKNIIL